VCTTFATRASRAATSTFAVPPTFTWSNRARSCGALDAAFAPFSGSPSRTASTLSFPLSRTIRGRIARRA
jgi:hypothetical protein